MELVKVGPVRQNMNQEMLEAVNSFVLSNSELYLLSRQSPFLRAALVVNLVSCPRRPAMFVVP